MHAAFSGTRHPIEAGTIPCRQSRTFNCNSDVTPQAWALGLVLGVLSLVDVPQPLSGKWDGALPRNHACKDKVEARARPLPHVPHGGFACVQRSSPHARSTCYEVRTPTRRTLPYKPVGVLGSMLLRPG